MGQWTRADKIAFWSLVVAIISCPLLYQIPAVRQAIAGGRAEFEQTELISGEPEKSDQAREDLTSAQRELVEMQKRKIEEEAKANREEARRLRKQREDIRLNRIELLAKEFEPPAKTLYDRISLKNNCSKPIYVALRYLDLDNVWVTRGWWKLEPGSIAQTGAKTRNRFIYFFAENRAEELTWDGSGDENAPSLDVAGEAFYHIGDEPFSFEGRRAVLFFSKDNTGKSWTNYEQRFSCKGN